MPKLKINSGQIIKLDKEDVAKARNLNLFITVDRPNRVHFRHKRERIDMSLISFWCHLVELRLVFTKTATI